MKKDSSIKILITGSEGQLGFSLKKISTKYPDFIYYFTDVNEMDITDETKVGKIFNEFQPQYCINSAAYTAVDKAESDHEMCYKINVKGPELLAKYCSIYNTKLIHISTDYVYNPSDNDILTEDSPTNPNNYYGKTKLDGELIISTSLNDFIIIRTSWLYSEFGNNFVKTILKLAQEKEELNVVNDQTGSPTYAGDLANAIMHIIEKKGNMSGIYNFTNEGFITWYDFAKEIIDSKGLKCKINPVPSTEFPTPASRPKNSKLSKSKILEDYKIKSINWKNSLKFCLDNLID
jgi:dTDP-4-dehydrorhamnose reductase